MLKLPTQVPKIGFYYHYKHDFAKEALDYAYEVTGVGFHTETEEVFVNYRPLYEDAAVYQASKKLGITCTDERPIEMWMENITKDGKTFPRFSKITDPKVIAELEKVRDEMYKS